MKVLFLSNYFLPHIGGVEKHIYELSKRLVNKFEVSIITEKFRKDLKDYEKIDGLNIFRVSYPHIKFLGLFTIWVKMFFLLKQIKQADVIHIHDVFIWYLPMRFLFPFKKVFVTFHGYRSYPLSNKEVLDKKIAFWLTENNICVGDFIKKWYGIKTNFVTYGGINLSEITKEQYNRKTLKNAIFIGRLDEQTSFKVYWKVYREISKLRDFQMFVLGDGKYRRLVTNQNCSGFVDNVGDYLNQSRYAFVSRYLSILEAFAYRRIVFAISDNPIKKDYLEMTPFKNFLVICQNVDELKEKVLYYIDHPYEEDKLVNAAYQWVQDETWEKVVSLYLKMWNFDLK